MPATTTIDFWPLTEAPNARLRVMTVAPEVVPADGPVVLFLHGAGEAGESDSDIVRLLMHQSPPYQVLHERLSGATVIAAQPRVNPKSKWNWRLYVADLAVQLSKRYPGRRLLACGFSRGGLGVLQLVAQAPALVTRWALVDPQAPGGPDEENLLVKAIGAMDVGWIRYGPQFDSIAAFGKRLAGRATGGRVCFADMQHGQMAAAAFSGDRLAGPDSLYEHLGLPFGDADERHLRQLNRDTFAAEDHASADEMAPLLDEGFKIARSTWEVQNKSQMLQRIANDTSRKTRAVDDERVRVLDNRAVVTSRVTLREADGSLGGQFWNLKVCIRRDGKWKCAAWHVSRLPEENLRANDIS